MADSTDPCVPTNYGAVAAAAGAVSSSDTATKETSALLSGSVADTSFDADQTYYLKGNGTQWTRRKIFATIVPILAALLIMGGIAYLLLRDFGHLYPGRGGDRSPFYANGGMSTKSSDDTTDVSSSAASSNHNIRSSSSSTSRHPNSNDSDGKFIAPNGDDLGASCSVHPDCSMLLGDCCPTQDGKMLVCCSNRR